MPHHPHAGPALAASDPGWRLRLPGGCPYTTRGHHLHPCHVPRGSGPTGVPWRPRPHPCPAPRLARGGCTRSVPWEVEEREAHSWGLLSRAPPCRGQSASLQGALRSGSALVGSPLAWSGVCGGQGRRAPKGLLPLLRLLLFPGRGSGRIIIFLPNRASELCCEQFGNSRCVSGSLAPSSKAGACSELSNVDAPHQRPELMLLLFVWTCWVQTRLIEMRTQFPLDNRTDSEEFRLVQEVALLSLFISANLGPVSKRTLRELSAASAPPAPGRPLPSALQLKDN